VGRHVFERESTLSRIRSAISGALLGPTRFISTQFKRFTRPSLTGAWAAAAFTAVSIVDPYSGNLASAATFEVYQQSDETPSQLYGWGASQTISYSRGGYNIVTGKDAAKLFVAQAEIPSSGTVKAIAYGMMAITAGESTSIHV